MATIQLSREAFFHNLDIIAQQTSSVDKIALVLKDNAYGHGLLEIAGLAREYGIGKAVVRTDAEAFEIREYFEYILVLADTPKQENPNAVYTANSLDDIKRFPKKTKVALKFDTGMHRNGICFKLMDEAIYQCREHDLELVDIFSHHRSADTLSSEWFWQKKNFEMAKKSALSLCEKYGYKRPRLHSSNSASLFRHNHFDEDLARVGIVAYGCLRMDKTLYQPDIKPVMSLWADRMSSQTLKMGQRLGYNATFEPTRLTQTSTYDVGYSDGLLRSASNQYITPKGYPLLGRVSMDNSSFGSIQDEICIFNDANSYAKAAGTISYEVLVGMRPHIKRVVV